VVSTFTPPYALLNLLSTGTTLLFIPRFCTSRFTIAYRGANGKPGHLGRYADGLRAGRPEFISRQGAGNCLLHTVHTLGVKRPGRRADHSHLVLRTRIVELYFHSPIHLHGLALN
jgi:hypothetical protein